MSYEQDLMNPKIRKRMANSYIHPDNVHEGESYDGLREEVRELRLQETSCEEIANQLGIAPERVKLYCLELGLPTEGAVRRLVPPTIPMADLRETIGEICPECGEEIIQSWTGRRKKFCSRVCKDRWKNKHRAGKSMTARVAVCKNCGNHFLAEYEYKGERKYCCRECYFEDRYGRER